MTDLERKLAEALRGQAEEVTPNLDAAWAEQMRRQRRPRRRRATVWLAPLAAVLVVLTSVLLATKVDRSPAPLANPGQELKLAQPKYQPLARLDAPSNDRRLTEFAGQTDRWVAYAFAGVGHDGNMLFCIAAVPPGQLVEVPTPQYGTKSPQCAELGDGPVVAGYVGESGGPLPAGKAVYLVDLAAHGLELFDRAGNLSQGHALGVLRGWEVYIADVDPGSPPVRFRVS